MKITIEKDGNIVWPEREEILKEGDYTKYFASRMNELAFYLKFYSPKYDAQLKIKPIHKADGDRARSLRKNYLKIFHPDKNIPNNTGLDLNEVCEDIEKAFRLVIGVNNDE